MQVPARRATLSVSASPARSPGRARSQSKTLNLYSLSSPGHTLEYRDAHPTCRCARPRASELSVAPRSARQPQASHAPKRCPNPTPKPQEMVHAACSARAAHQRSWVDDVLVLSPHTSHRPLTLTFLLHSASLASSRLGLTSRQRLGLTSRHHVSASHARSIHRSACDHFQLNCNPPTRGQLPDLNRRPRRRCRQAAKGCPVDLIESAEVALHVD